MSAGDTGRPSGEPAIVGVDEGGTEAETLLAAASEVAQSADELKEERRKIRRLQLMMNMVLSTIGQDPSLTVEEAAELVANSRRTALTMFPDKELAYNLIYKPRIQRLMRERYNIQ